jgi:hypothetical protein
LSKAVRELSKHQTARKMIAQQRALEVGKAGYKKSDDIIDQLVEDVDAGRLTIGEFIDLPGGDKGRLIDTFDGKTKKGYGGAVRRYEVEIVKADDITKKL